MTLEEFKNVKWHTGMTALYDGNWYHIASADFQEFLIALDGVVSGSDEPSWVRCENVESIDD